MQSFLDLSVLEKILFFIILCLIVTLMFKPELLSRGDGNDSSGFHDSSDSETWGDSDGDNDGGGD